MLWSKWSQHPVECLISEVFNHISIPYSSRCTLYYMLKSSLYFPWFCRLCENEGTGSATDPNTEELKWESSTKKSSLVHMCKNYEAKYSGVQNKKLSAVYQITGWRFHSIGHPILYGNILENTIPDVVTIWIVYDVTIQHTWNTKKKQVQIN